MEVCMDERVAPEYTKRGSLWEMKADSHSPGGIWRHCQCHAGMRLGKVKSIWNWNLWEVWRTTRKTFHKLPAKRNRENVGLLLNGASYVEGNRIDRSTQWLLCLGVFTEKMGFRNPRPLWPGGKFGAVKTFLWWRRLRLDFYRNLIHGNPQHLIGCIHKWEGAGWCNLAHQMVVLPFRGTSTAWKIWLKGISSSSTRWNISPCAWGGIPPGTSTNRGLTVWKAARQRWTLGSWWTTHCLWASNTPLSKERKWASLGKSVVSRLREVIISLCSALARHN